MDFSFSSIVGCEIELRTLQTILNQPLGIATGTIYFILKEPLVSRSVELSRRNVRHIEVNRDVSWLKTEKATQQNSVPLTFVSLFRNVNAFPLSFGADIISVPFVVLMSWKRKENLFGSADFSRGTSLLLCSPGCLQCSHAVVGM